MHIIYEKFTLSVEDTVYMLLQNYYKVCYICNLQMYLIES